MKLSKKVSALLVCTFSLVNTPLHSNPTRLRVNLQNEMTTPNLKRTITLDGVADGPRDKYVSNPKGIEILKDINADFLKVTTVLPDSGLLRLPLKHNKKDIALAINAWGIISLTKRLVERSIFNGGILDPSHLCLRRWKQQKPVKLVISRRGEGNNAFYDPKTQSIRLLPIRDERTHKIIGNTAGDFDIVAHESIHNACHILRPKQILQRPQTGALHESLADFLSFSTLFCYPAICRIFIDSNGGDFRKSSFLSQTGELLSQSTGSSQGIRNALNEFKIKDVEYKPHALSTVHTGILYDILANAYDKQKPGFVSGLFQGASEIYRRLGRVNEDIRRVVLAAYCLVPYRTPTFNDFGHTMVKIAKENKPYQYLAEIIEGAYEARDIDISLPHNVSKKPDIKALKRAKSKGKTSSHICSTMAHIS